MFRSYMRVKMKSRREARELALRIMYAFELSGNPLDVVLEQIFPGVSRESYHQFALDLVNRTVRMRDWIDGVIKEHVEKWELERIAVLDRIILRLAVCELYFFDDIPLKVTVNEAIEIAKKYSTEKSDKFVNGVLDAVMQQKLRGEHEVIPSDAADL